jgi:hypothetical protein
MNKGYKKMGEALDEEVQIFKAMPDVAMAMVNDLTSRIGDIKNLVSFIKDGGTAPSPVLVPVPVPS